MAREGDSGLHFANADFGGFDADDKRQNRREPCRMLGRVVGEAACRLTTWTFQAF